MFVYDDMLLINIVKTNVCIKCSYNVRINVRIK